MVKFIHNTAGRAIELTRNWACGHATRLLRLPPPPGDPENMTDDELQTHWLDRMICDIGARVDPPGPCAPFDIYVPPPLESPSIQTVGLPNDSVGPYYIYGQYVLYTGVVVFFVVVVFPLVTAVVIIVVRFFKEHLLPGRVSTSEQPCSIYSRF